MLEEIGTHVRIQEVFDCSMYQLYAVNVTLCHLQTNTSDC